MEKRKIPYCCAECKHSNFIKYEEPFCTLASRELEHNTAKCVATWCPLKCKGAQSMKESEAYDRIVIEYLSKCRDYGCDGCIAQCYCISNGLRADRYPQKDCSDKIKKYLRQL